MSVFKDKEQLHQVLGGFFAHLVQNPDIGPRLKTSGLRLRFHYREPDTCIYVGLSQDPVQIDCGNTSSPADVEMTMKADVAHRFWQGKVNLVVALTRREITAKGPIPKILKLLPIIKPAYQLYGPYLENMGFSVESQPPR